REQRRVRLDRIDRGKPEPRQLRHELEHRADELAERHLAGKVLAVSGDVDAGQHDLRIALRGEPPRLRHHLAGRNRARWPAAERDDAKGTAMVAAVLDLHIGARAIAEALDQM